MLSLKDKKYAKIYPNSWGKKIEKYTDFWVIVYGNPEWKS